MVEGSVLPYFGAFRTVPTFGLALSRPLALGDGHRDLGRPEEGRMQAALKSLGTRVQAGLEVTCKVVLLFQLFFPLKTLK